MEANPIAVPTRVVPNHAPASARRRISVPLAAMLCGAGPLSFGIAVFLLWLITRSQVLEFAGILTIYVGSIFVAAGCIALAIHGIIQRRRAAQPVSWWPTLKELLILTLLLSNFPVAAAIVSTVVYLESEYTVTVTNSRQATIDDLTVRGPGGQIHHGPLKPQQSFSATLHPSGRGEIDLVRTQAGQKTTDVVDGYVDGTLGGVKTVTINGAAVQVK